MPITTTPDVPVPASRYVPADFDPTDLEALARSVQGLLDRPVAGPDELEEWLHDWSELEARVWAGRSRRRIRMTLDTEDESIRAAHLAYEKDVVPAWQRHDHALSRRYVQLGPLGGRFAVFDRRVAAEVELFREKNVPLKVRDEELRTQYARMTGARTVAFRGETLTAQQCAGYLEERDRATREEAYRALGAARGADADAAEALLDEMLALRGRIARQADLDDYRAYAFKDKRRFDYTPADCVVFHEAVEEVVVPAVCQRMERRRERLGLDSVRPFDLVVDPRLARPLQPFANEDSFVNVIRRVFHAVDPIFDDEFSILVRNRLLDLMSRPGKASGGYNAQVADIRLPFIFMNAIGRHRDIRTLLHEGGHAFHTLATRDEPILKRASAPMEFCEVASMAMEHFGLEHYDAVYESAEARAAAAGSLEERLWVFTWIATVDAFQHWLYTHPDHTREERAEKWVGLRRRFAPYLEWGGLEAERATEWHGQLHIFRYPFYYIEYGIALLGAFQLWRRYRTEPAAAIDDYRAALRLGGTRDLPQLFATAGARFAMDATVFREVTDDVVRVLAELDG